MDFEEIFLYVLDLFSSEAPEKYFKDSTILGSITSKLYIKKSTILSFSDSFEKC